MMQATAPRSQVYDEVRWQARAVELAQQRHLTGTARFLGYTP